MLLSLAATSTASADIVARYNFEGNTGSEALAVPTILDSRVLASNLNRGSGLEPATAADSFAATHWQGPEASDYFTFSVEPEIGYQIDLESLELGVLGSAATSSFELLWSLDGFGSVLGSVALASTATARTLDFDTPLSIFEQVEFRLQAVGLGNNDEFAALTSQNGMPGLALNGSVSAVPEPGSLALLTLTGLVAAGATLKKRRSRLSRSAQ